MGECDRCKELEASLANAQQRIVNLKSDAIHKATPFTAAACMKVEEENADLRADLKTVARALSNSDHGSTCPLGWAQDEGYSCTCGRDAALALPLVVEMLAESEGK